jgi:hypothetical protein
MLALNKLGRDFFCILKKAFDKPNNFLITALFLKKIYGISFLSWFIITFRKPKLLKLMRVLDITYPNPGVLVLVKDFNK